ncbi:MAG TPA: hypothetical protein VFW50_36640 [Streptosporangiaceae bacterium]|nr:hypothetical protein [Streptosporangiaceae bacterium]
MVGAQALDDLAHDPDLTAAVHLLLARAAVGAGVSAEAGQHLDAASGLGTLSPRRIAQVRIMSAAAVIACGTVGRHRRLPAAGDSTWWPLSGLTDNTEHPGQTFAQDRTSAGQASPRRADRTMQPRPVLRRCIQRPVA